MEIRDQCQISSLRTILAFCQQTSHVFYLTYASGCFVQSCRQTGVYLQQSLWTWTQRDKPNKQAPTPADMLRVPSKNQHAVSLYEVTRAEKPTRAQWEQTPPWRVRFTQASERTDFWSQWVVDNLHLRQCKERGTNAVTYRRVPTVQHWCLELLQNLFF